MRRLTPRFLPPVFALLALICFANLAHADDCTALANGANAKIIGPNDVCKSVTNNAGAELCVTTYSTAEWTSFYGSPPANVSVGSCGCAGYSSGGYCYYLSAGSSTCTAICGSHGGCQLAGLTAIAEGTGTSAACQTVIRGIYNGTAVGTDGGASGAYGCVAYVYSSYYAYWFHGTTTCAGVDPYGYGRACSCYY